MHRRFILAVTLAASSLVVVSLAAPEAAQSKPRSQRAEAQGGFFRLFAKPQAKRVKRVRRTKRTRGRANRFDEMRASRTPRQVRSHKGNVARTSMPYQDTRFNYGPRKAVSERRVIRRRTSRHVLAPEFARTSTPYQDTRFNYGPRKAVTVRRVTRRRIVREVAVTHVARTSTPYQDDRFNYGPRKAVTEPRTARRSSARQNAVTRVVPDWTPYRDNRFTYRPLKKRAAERKVDRRRTAQPTFNVARTSTSYQDDRFNYGPREAVAQRQVRRRARNAMARAYVGPTPDRNGDDGFNPGPRLQSVHAGGWSSNVVSEARRWIGPNNPTDRRSLWCARFMNFVLERSGYKGTGSDLASSFARYGRRVAGPQVGAIAVMWRGRRGGHVGVVSGIDEHGNPIIISGNHGNRVAEAAYPRRRIYAYVMPL